jgi:predicted oxidoreductase
LARQWAKAYIDFAAGEMRSRLHKMGLRWFPIVGWAERGGSFTDGHGNSVPRFHITWGNGPGVLEHFIRRCRAHQAAGLIQFQFRHQVDQLEMRNGVATGVSGPVLADDDSVQGARTNRDVIGSFRLDAAAIIVISGGHRRKL